MTAPRHPGRGPGFFPRSKLGEDTSPRITFVSPAAGPLAGGAVTLTGSYFTPGATVRFGGVLATDVVVVDTTHITAVAPVHASGTVDVTITDEYGRVATLTHGYAYIPSVITSVEPNNGLIAGGTVVFITGVNFETGATITFGGVAATGITFLDSQHYIVTTPAHVAGPVAVVVDDATLQGGFFFIELTDPSIRRAPAIAIHETWGTTPNTCSYTLGKEGAPPRLGASIEITDFADPPARLFAGVARIITQEYDEDGLNLKWRVDASDFTCRANRRRPYGAYVHVSATDVVLDLATRYIPWATTAHVQTNLPPVTVEFDGKLDFMTCLQLVGNMIGGGHARLDYDKDLHFFRYVNPSVPSAFRPESIMALGLGTSMVVTESGTEVSGYSFPAGYYVFRSSFLYSNGAESGVGPLSNIVALTGHRLPQFDGVPIGSAVGGLTVVARRIYYESYQLDEWVSWSGWVELQDNATTTLISSQGGAYTVGAPPLGSIDDFVPRVPYVAPVTGPDAPSVVESSLFARDVLGLIAPDQYGVSGSIPLLTYAPGRYAFVMTGVYEDGTESLPSSASNIVELFGDRAQSVTAPSVEDVGSISAVYRKLYAVKLKTNQTIPIFIPGQAVGWAIIPHNVAGVVDVSSGLQLNTMPTQGTTRYDSTEDGPWLEDDDPPAEVNDTNMDLCRDKPITLRLDITQLRNRVVVIGKGVAVATPVATPVTTETGVPIAATGTMNTPTDPVAPVINPYIGAAQGWSGTAPAFPDAVIGTYDSYPMNQRWTNLLNAFTDKLASGYQPGHATTGPSGSLPPTYVPSGNPYLYWYKENGLTEDYVRANPYTVFMDLPAGTYRVTPPASSDGEPGTPPVTELVEPPPKPAVNIVRPRIQVDDVASQQAMGLLERDENGVPGDGIYEGAPIEDESLETLEQMYARGNAELAVFAWPIANVNYSTWDRRSTVGSLVPFNLSKPPVSGEFLIQTVDIDQVHESDELTPRHNVGCSSVKFDLDDLLRLIFLRAAGGDVDISGLAPAAAAQAQLGVLGALAGATGGVFSIKEKTLTAAQLGDLFATPVMIVDGVANKLIVPLFWTLQQEMGGVLFNAAPSVVPRYVGSTGALLSTIGVINVANVKKTIHESAAGVSLPNNDVWNGVGVQLVGGATRTGGSGTFTFTMAYYLIDAVYE